MGARRTATTDDDRRLIRALARENAATRRELAAIDAQLLDLMDRRDELLAELSRTNNQALAEKFGASVSHIIYVCRPRSLTNVT